MDDPTDKEPTSGAGDETAAPDAAGAGGEGPSAPPASPDEAPAEPAAGPAEPAPGPAAPSEPAAGAEGAPGPAAPTAAPPPPSPPAPPPEPPAEPAATGAPKPLYKQPVFAIAALALLVGSIVAGNLIFKRDAPPGGASPSPTATASPSPTEAATKDFRNVEAGIVFKYPADWDDLEGDWSDATIAALGTGRGELLRLEVFLLEEAPTPQAVASREVQELLDKNIAQNPDATVTTRELRSINGTNAWHYIAQFEDKDLGVGVWDVWFFFSGSKLEKLLFQAFPLSEYNARYRAIFDGIVATYRTVPRAPGGSPAPPPTGPPAASPAG